MFPGLGGSATLPTGAPALEPSPAEDGTKLIDLSEKLDKPLCYARNENAAYPWGNLFIGDSRLGTQSDADEQLIIHLSFQEFVKVRPGIFLSAHLTLLCALSSHWFSSATGKKHQIYGVE